MHSENRKINILIKITPRAYPWRGSYVTQINSENIKTTNLFSRMHYSGPDSPAFSQLNKKKHYDVTSPKFKLLIYDTGPTYNMIISYIAI